MKTTWTRSRTRWACPRASARATPRSWSATWSRATCPPAISAGCSRSVRRWRASRFPACRRAPRAWPCPATRPSRTRCSRSPGTARRRPTQALSRGRVAELMAGAVDGGSRHLPGALARRVRAAQPRVDRDLVHARGRRPRDVRRSRRQDPGAGRADLLRGGRGRGAGDLRGDAALGRGARDRQDGGGAEGAGARATATC